MLIKQNLYNCYCGFHLFFISINTKSLIVILGLTFFFLGLFPILSLSEVNGDSSGITKLKKLGNKIGNLDFNSGVFLWKC